MSIGGQYHSISVSGMQLFRRPIQSTVGGITIDLASAPLVPGVHELRIESAFGGVEIYMPAYVQFTVEGGRIIGGYDVHDGLGWIERAESKLRRVFRMANQIPKRVAPAPVEPVTIRILLDGVAGGLDVYRLAPEA
jgi:hypothetical protein